MAEENAKRLIGKYADLVLGRGGISGELYAKYEIKRGLRDVSGKGALVGLTEISEIVSYITEDGDYVPCEGKLFYSGINIDEIVRGFLDGSRRFGFEETTFLLLFGHLPNEREFADFCGLLEYSCALPGNFLRDAIMAAPSKDMMNSLSRSALALHAYDDDPDDISIANVVRQSISLIARLPQMAIYGYQAFARSRCGQSLAVYPSQPGLSIAENFLHMMRADSKYSKLEAEVLDIALMLHAEHGGGNNSTFTAHVVTSSHTDTYSAVAAALCSLKGPRHGGACVKVAQMFQDIREKVRDWNDDDEIAAYLEKIIAKEAFDRAGVVYGIGHSVYSLSDPRALIFKHFVEQLAYEKGRGDEYALHARIEELAPAAIGRARRIYKGVSANIDFYSGFAYDLLGLPRELFTPLFAVARVSGWCAHRVEELANSGKIIRPAYKSVAKQRYYMPMGERS